MATKTGTGTETLTRPKQEVRKPSMYKVLLHNDDYTTMEFVVSVLMTVFLHSEASAFEVMMHVHKNGVGVAGIYTREIAETKMAKATKLAREHKHPLEVTIEAE